MGGVRDPLTGLFLRDTLQKITRKYIKEGIPFSLVLMDIDRFKLVNDVFGHQIGDNILLELTKFIHKFLRKGDLFIRYGGDEFVIFLPETPAENAHKAIERIKNMIELEYLNLDPPIRVSFSTGIASFPNDGESLSELIARADERLYINKKKGKTKNETKQAFKITKFIGRNWELKILRKILMDAGRGNFKSAFILGKPGTGKTRLVMEALELAKITGLKYVIHKFFPYHRKIPPDLKTLKIKENDVVVLEDIHNLSPDVISRIFQTLISYMGRKVFIITARDNELDEAFLDSFIQLAKEQSIDIIKLDVLDLYTTSELLHYLLKSSVHRNVVEKFYLKSGGNPLYLFEIAKSSIEKSKLVKIEDIWYLQGEIPTPDVIRNLIEIDFKCLPANEQNLLYYGALLDGEFDVEVFSHIFGEQESKMVFVFLDLVSKGWLRESSPGKFIFVHGITGDILKSQLSETQKRLMYRKIARVLKKLRKDEGILARCYYCAEIYSLAFKYAYNVGKHYYNRGIFRDAIKYLQMAAKSAEHVKIPAKKLGDIYYLLADSFLEIGEYDNALKYIELSEKKSGWERFLFLRYKFSMLSGDIENAYNYLVKLIKRTRNREHKFRYRIHLLGLLMDWGKLDEFRTMFKRIRRSMKSINNPSLEIGFCATALSFTGRIYNEIEQQCVKKLLELSGKTDLDQVDKIVIFSSLGTYYLKDLERALFYLKSALKEAESAGDVAREASILTNIGTIWSRHGYQYEAIRWYERALKTKEKVGDLKGMIIVSIDLGYAYSIIGQFEKAEKILLEGVAKNDLYVKSDLLGFHLWHGLAFTWLRSEKFDRLNNAIEKMKNYTRALGDYLPGEADFFTAYVFVKRNMLDNAGKIFEKLKLRSKDDFAYYFLAIEYYLALREFDMALKVARDALSEAENSQFLWEKGIILRYMSEIFYKLKNNGKAREFAKKSIEIFRRIGNSYEAKESRKLLNKLT